MCHRKLNIPYNIFSTKINKSFNYRNHSYLYSPFNVGVNVFRYRLICEYLTWQLIPATIYHRHTRAVTRRAERSPSRGRILWAQPLPFTPKTQGTRRGGGTGWAAAPLAGAWRAEMGRAARVHRGRPGSVPHLSAVSVSTRPLRVAGDLRRVLLGE